MQNYSFKILRFESRGDVTVIVAEATMTFQKRGKAAHTEHDKDIAQFICRYRAHGIIDGPIPGETFTYQELQEYAQIK